MRLMGFSDNIMYTARKDLTTADTLSCAPGVVQLYRISNRKETLSFFRAVIGNISVSDKRLEEIRLKQNTNRVCSQVISYYKIDHWPETAR